MTRRDFTKNLAMMLLEMHLAGEQPILDYVKRTDAGQKWLFDQGKSKCDGVEKVSRHQRGAAADIYLCHYDGAGHIRIDFTWAPEQAAKWHKRWEDLGGRAMIAWDPGHFE